MKNISQTKVHRRVAMITKDLNNHCLLDKF